MKKINKMRIAVTGSSGFIGSHLVTKIKEKQFELVEISRTTGCDISNFNSVKDIKACDIIVHLAAKTFVPDSFDNPAEFYKFNYASTLNVLELARLWNAKVIYMSSYFYGPPQYLPVDENHPLKPHNPYAQSKLHSEELCKAYARDFKLNCISLRLFNIYGPGQRNNFLIPEIFEKMKTASIVLNDPRPKRDYIHVYDVVDAIIKCFDSKSHSNFEVYNLGTGISISVKRLVEIILQQNKSNATVEFLNKYRPTEVLDSVAGNEKIIKFLDIQKFMSIEEGLKTLAIND